MINNIKSFIVSNNLQNSNIIVAISGGPDSVCLLMLLQQIKEQYNLKLSAAYVNHGIRNPEENLKDYKLIKQLCNSISSELYVKEFKEGELEQRAHKKGVGVEAIAREVRYSFFDSLIRDKGTYIALGHNRDDQLETQIMRFFQGSSVDGLIGIKAINKSYIRPMFSITKKEILDFLHREGIPYNVDKTNLENNYLRNSIRNRLIPLIKEIFPGYSNSLKKLEDEFLLISLILEDGYNSEVWKRQGDFWVLNYPFFLQQNFYIRKKLIYDIFNRSYAGDIKDYRLPERFLKPLIKHSFRNGEKVLEGHGFILKRDGDLMVWSKVDCLEEVNCFEVFEPSKVSNDNIVITISDENPTGVTVCGLTFPFVIRSCNSSDNKLFKKLNLTLNYRNTFIIEKCYNNIYAIISDNRIIYAKYKNSAGLTINFEKL